MGRVSGQDLVLEKTEGATADLWEIPHSCSPVLGNLCRRVRRDDRNKLCTSANEMLDTLQGRCNSMRAYAEDPFPTTATRLFRKSTL